ncbi:hypothetical protein [Rhizobium sp. S163]|uniref:hypothetical protein n=1 Tax=Rhizobium sp. S163 TaxID=3055039 RepID=UPI0025A9BBF9|nr:hypothetical protein [Rhizobium sp. S163]MDM9647696.1 hypothetical protein [Rhizobium sp. S163]
MKWEKVFETVEHFSERIDIATKCAVRSFVSYASANLVPPSEVLEGIFPTVRISWNDPPMEVEIFSGSFETYDFRVIPAGIESFDIVEVGQLPHSFTKSLEPLRLDL